MLLPNVACYRACAKIFLGMYEELIFIDEYGDPASKGSPHFALIGLYIPYVEYENKVVPSINGLRMRYLFSLAAPLHDRKLRKGEYPFYAFKDHALKRSFYGDFVGVAEKFNMKIAVVIVRKSAYSAKYSGPKAKDKYRLALQFLLERMNYETKSDKVGVIIESRGEEKDKHLVCVAHGTCLVGHSSLRPGKFGVIFLNKNHISPGLELADLLLASAARVEMNKAGIARLGFKPPSAEWYDNVVYEKVIKPRYREGGKPNHAVKFFPDLKYKAHP